MNSVYHTNELVLFSQLEHILNKGHSIFRLPTKQRNASLLTSHSGNEFLSKLTGDTFFLSLLMLDYRITQQGDAIFKTCSIVFVITMVKVAVPFKGTFLRRL